MGDEDKKSRIVTDAVWKEQARKEKEQLAQEEQEQAKSAPAEEQPARGPLPRANFITLVNSLVVQIWFSLGRVSDPNAKEAPPVNLDLAKHHIDILQVLEDKTKGNLTEQENRILATALHEVRMQYVEAVQT